MLCVALVVSAVSVMAFTGCMGTDVAEMAIVAVSRESGSGTRGQWDASIHNTLEGDARMTLADWIAAGPGGTRLLAGEMQHGQSGVVTRVGSQRNAIGYASLSAIENLSNVRVLTIDGVAPGAAGYPAALARDYVILTYENVTLLPLTQLFLEFMQSAQGGVIVENAGYDFSVENAPTFVSPAARPAGQAEPIQIRGSTSVEIVMGDLIDGFVAAVSWAQLSDFDFQAGGSGQGVTAGTGGTVQGSVPNRTIGMSSNAAHINTTNANAFFLAQDTMAAFVNSANPITNITIAQLFDIYTGAITQWADIINA